MARKVLTEKMVAALRPGRSRVINDAGQPGLFIRVRNTTVTWLAMATDPATGRKVWRSLAPTNELTLDKARARAREVVAEIKSGRKASSLKVPKTVGEIAEAYYQREVVAKGLRSAAEIRRTLDNHVLPCLAELPFEELSRAHVTELCDRIADRAGVCAADRTLTRLKAIASWHCDRLDIADPLAGKKRLISQKERERDRILDDDELRQLWSATEDCSTFHAMVRMLLLTGQRLEKVSTMRWEDIEQGAWQIPTEAREKGNGGVLKLPPHALDLLAHLPKIVGNPFVFPGRHRHYNGFSKSKRRLAQQLAFKKQWGLHDLRRTARSLMARAGIEDHIAERTIGHTQKGVQATYNRHDYTEEKAHALAALDQQLAIIMGGSKVVRLKSA